MDDTPDSGEGEDLSGELPSGDADLVTADVAISFVDEALSTVLPKDADPEVRVVEEIKLEGRGFSIGIKSFPGTLVNRISVLAVMIMLATIAAYATTGVCEVGSTTGNAVTAIGLVSFAAVLVLGILWVTKIPSVKARAPKQRVGRHR